ncbi:MAG: 6,7-dimethyl-8-ribityllumazine synthase [Phycisphaerales bacterium]
MPRAEPPLRGAGPPRVAVIVSRYNGSITGALLEGALDRYEFRAGPRAAVAVFDAPGAFELPVLALAAAQSGVYDAVVALGCLIKGETRHDRYIADACARGLAEASLRTGVPIAFGVLTVDTPDQARQRAGGRDGNKGADAMDAALDAFECLRAIRTGATAWPKDRAAATPRARDKAAPGRRAAAGKRA